MPEQKQNKKPALNGKKPGFKKKIEFRVNLTPKNIFLWMIIGIILMFIFIGGRDVSKIFPSKPLSNLIDDIKNGQVKKVEGIDTKLLTTYKNDKIYSTTKEGQ